MNTPLIKGIIMNLDRMLAVGAIPVENEYLARSVRDLAKAVLSEEPVIMGDGRASKEELDNYWEAQKEALEALAP